MWVFILTTNPLPLVPAPFKNTNIFVFISGPRCVFFIVNGLLFYFIFLNLYPWYFGEFKTKYPSTWDTGLEPVVSTMQQSVVQIKIHLWGKLRVTSMNATCSYYCTILWFCGIEHQDGACGQGVISWTMLDTHWTMFEISGRNIFLEPFLPDIFVQRTMHFK